MSIELDFPVLADGPIAREALERGFTSFLPLAKHIRRIPYGRPRNGQDILAALKEQVGTCSAKHRLLAAVAHDCGRFDIELVVGIYGMSEENTPGVGAVLGVAGLRFIPEAHCYLRVGGRRYDFTGLRSGSASPFDALLSELVVSPATLPEEKARLHHAAVRAWSEGNALVFSEAWALREACIAALVSSNALLPTV